MSLNLPMPGLSGRAHASGDTSPRSPVADVTPVADAAASSGEATPEVKSTFDKLMAQHTAPNHTRTHDRTHAKLHDGTTVAAHPHHKPELAKAQAVEKAPEKPAEKPVAEKLVAEKTDDTPVRDVAARSQKPAEARPAKPEKVADEADSNEPLAGLDTDTAADPQTADTQTDPVVIAEAASPAVPVAADALPDIEVAEALPLAAKSGGVSPLLPPAADDEPDVGSEVPDGKGDFAGFFDKAVKGRGAVAQSAPGQKSTDPTGKDAAGDDQNVSTALNRPAEAEVKAVLARVQTGLDAFQQARNTPTSDTKSAEPAALPVTQSDTSTPASGFSLQALADPHNDIQGSYSASGASAASASNLSKAAVESLSALSVQISKHLSEGNTRFALELHPADLGKVEVSLNISRDGKTTAHLRFDNPVTASTFSAHEADLRQQLAQTGLTIDKDSLSFSSRDADDVSSFGSSFAQEQQREQQQQNQSQQARLAARALQAADQSASEVDANTALDTALARFRNRTPSQTIALNLIV